MRSTEVWCVRKDVRAVLRVQELEMHFLRKLDVVMGISTDIATDILHYALRGQPFTPPPGTFVALYSGDPQADGTELEGGQYTRRPTSFSPDLASENLMEFYDLPPSKSPVSHYAVYDSPIPGQGRLLFSESFTTTHPLRGGETIRIAEGAIRVV